MIAKGKQRGVTILRHCCNNALGQINQLLPGFQVSVKVPFGAKVLDAALCLPASAKDARTAVILTHGAGGDMNFRHLRSLAHALASAGVICLRFTCKSLNLGYRVKAYRSVWVSSIYSMHPRLFLFYFIELSIINHSLLSSPSRITWKHCRRLPSSTYLLEVCKSNRSSKPMHFNTSIIDFYGNKEMVVFPLVL